MSVSIPIITFLYKKEARNKTLWTLFVYLIVCLITDAITNFIENDEYLNVVSNIFTFIEFTMISIIYFLEFETLRLKRIIAFVYGAYFLLTFWQFFYLNKIVTEDVFICSIGAFIIISFSWIFIFKFLFSPVTIKLSSYYLFWIVFSNLAYFSTAFVFFMFGHVIQNAPMKLSILLWGTHDLITVGCYLLFAVGIWKVQKK